MGVESVQGTQERRLVQRVMAYWVDLRGERRFPRLAEVSSCALGEDWQWCFVLDLKTADPFPIFQYLGTDLCKLSGIFLSGKNDWTSTVLDKVTERVDEVKALQASVMVEDELRLFNQQRLLFRFVMLPLGEDDRLTHVLGAGNGMLVPDTAHLVNPECTHAA
ncbi:MAG: PAS domain-containing protein [Pseudomonadota bacterium]